MFFKKKKVDSSGVGKIVINDSTFQPEGYNKLKDNILFMNADNRQPASNPVSEAHKYFGCDQIPPC